MRDPTTLARRVAACPVFRWMPGMLAVPLPKYADHVKPRRIHTIATPCDFPIGVPPGDTRVRPDNHTITEWDVHETEDRRVSVPDLADPATLGALAALAWEHGHGPEWGIAWDEYTRAVFDEGPTAAVTVEALVRVLEEVPDAA